MEPPLPKRPPDIAQFIRANLPLTAVPDVPDIRLHTAHPGSGLRHLVADDEDAPPPYWAYQWGGGIVLARHILDHPGTVRGKRVLDLGAGGGIAAIAAMRAGAQTVTAAEINPHGRIAIGLNAGANDVPVAIIGDDLLSGAAPDVDLILVSDLFYAPDLAQTVSTFLGHCATAGISILIGDPFRASLPRERLNLLAEYQVQDFGSTAKVRAAVFGWKSLE